MSLSNAQLIVLRDHIVANTDPAVVSALAAGAHAAIADLYNLDHPTATAWATSVDASVYRAALDFTEVEGLDVAKQTAFEWMTGGLTEALDFSVLSIRNGIAAVFPTNGPGASPNTRAAMNALFQRPASVFERVFMSSDGPETLAVVGPVQHPTISAALAMP